jgi:hypothetical protein
LFVAFGNMSGCVALVPVAVLKAPGPIRVGMRDLTT